MGGLVSAVVVTLVAGIAMTVIGVMGARRSLPRNPWAGIRLPVTTASDEAWQAAHAAAAGWMVAAGVVCLASVVVAVLGRFAGWTPGRSTGVVLAGLIGMTVLVLVGAVVGTQAAGRLDNGSRATR